MTETDFCQKINHIWHYKCYRHLYERLRDVLQKKNWLKTFGKNTNKQKIIIKKQIYVPHFKKSSDIRGSTLMGTFINSKWATFTQEVCCCGFVVSQGLVCLVNLCSLTTKSQPSPWRLKDKTWNLFSIKASRLPLSLNEPSDGGGTVEWRWSDGTSDVTAHSLELIEFPMVLCMNAAEENRSTVSCHSKTEWKRHVDKATVPVLDHINWQSRNTRCWGSWVRDITNMTTILMQSSD